MGRMITFEYYPYEKGDSKSGRLKEIRDFSGRVVSYEYNENGDLVKAEFEGRERTYTYKNDPSNLKLSHNLESVTDCNGQKYLELSYDSEDRLTSQKIGGISITISSGQTATTTDGNGNIRTYTHNELGNAISVVEGGFETKYTYNSDGLLTSITHPLGNKVEYTYDSTNSERRSQSNLLSVKRIPDSRGGETSETTLTYEPFTNQITSITYPRGNKIEFEIDERGNVLSVQYPEGIKYQYQYNKYGQILREVDPNGSLTEYEYYSESSPGGTNPVQGGRSLDPETGGYLRSIVKDKGGDNLSLLFQYDILGNILLEQNADGVSKKYEYDKYSQLISKTEGSTRSSSGEPPLNLKTTYSYDLNGNLISKEERGIETQYTYDILNRLISIERKGGDESQRFTFSYDNSSNLISIIYPKGNSDRFSYDSRNLLISKNLGEITKIDYKYDSNGNIFQLIDGESNTYTYLYDGHDRLKTILDPIGRRLEYLYDKNSNIESIIAKGAKGEIVQMQISYDSLDRMKSQKIGSIQNQFDYDKSSRLISFQNPNGNRWRYIRTGSGLVKEIVDPVENIDEIAWRRDGTIGSILEREKEGRMLKREFTTDVIGNLLREIDSAGREWRYGYDENLRLDSLKDPEGGLIQYIYDGLGRLKKEIRNITYGGIPTKYETIYTYDSNGNLLSVQDPNGNITKYEYDSKDRLIKIEYPDVSTEEFTYDRNDRLINYKDQNGTVVTNKYDSSGNLIRRDIARAEGVEGSTFEIFSYDGLGRMLKAEDSYSVVEFEYDELGRIVKERQNGKEVASFYDGNGNKISLIYPSGKNLSISYDQLDRIKSISSSEPIAFYSYEGKGKVIERSIGNLIKMGAGYDDGRRPVEISYKNISKNRELAKRAMSWNRVDLKTKERKIEENKEERYIYDSLLRLKSFEEDGGRVVKYEIDGVENIRKIEEKEKGVVSWKEIEINKRNQIVSYNGIPLRYDRNGNLKQFKDRYIYDWKNQLVMVEKENGEKVEFKYDVLGRRIEKKLIASNHTETTRYFYDGWRVIEERDQFERVKTKYTYGNWIDEVIEIEKDRDNDGIFETYYPLQNTIGSVIGLVGKDGEIVERISYSPYGKPTFIYDKIPPEVDSVRVEEGKIVVRFSEAVSRESAERAFSLRKGTTKISGSFSFEDESKLIGFTPSSPLPYNEELTISITTELEDLSGNNLKNEFSQSFTYTGTDSVIYDRVPPEIQSARLISNSFFIEFSEEIDSRTISDSIELSSSTGKVGGELSLDNSKTIKFTPSISLSRNSQYTITVKATVKDLTGKPLSEQFSKSFLYTGADLLIFQKPDPNQRKESSIGNTTLFHGREYDPETGLYYFRARYYHPELGRFLQPDPNGYEDSLNPSQSFKNNPINFTDPYGEQALQGISHEAILSAYRQLREQGYSEDEALERLERYGFIGSDRSYKLSIVITAKTKPITKVVESVGYVGSGFIPGVGEAQDIAVLVSGYDPVTMEKVSLFDRMASGIGLAIPVMGGVHIRNSFSKANDIARSVIKWFKKDHRIKTLSKVELSEVKKISKSVLRSQYETEVKGLATKAKELENAGYTSEEIARTLHAERRALGIKYKKQTPLFLRLKIYWRNIKLYGDPYGPSIKWLQKRGKSWEEIIESASRPGGKDLGL